MIMVGYTLRRQISKALQWRSEAIRKAIVRYNTQAAALSPSRTTISWKDITCYTFLGEFDFLCHSRTNVQDYEWSKPAVREATVKFFRLCRAQEEIVCLNIEVRRLRTAIHDEEQKTSKAIAALLISDPLLGLEAQWLYHSCAAVNAVHLHRVDKIEKLHGYSGQGGIGIHIKHLDLPATDVSIEESSLPLNNPSKYLFLDPSATLMCSF
jgi:hypothetical protein